MCETFLKKVLVKRTLMGLNLVNRTRVSLVLLSIVVSSSSFTSSMYCLMSVVQVVCQTKCYWTIITVFTEPFSAWENSALSQSVYWTLYLFDWAFRLVTLKMVVLEECNDSDLLSVSLNCIDIFKIFIAAENGREGSARYVKDKYGL